jgi:glycosyltransferase involved in cell wall biosynthesis
MKVAVIVPCYNEEQTIGKVVADFRRELPDATIYVGDNNSTDRTAYLAESAGATVMPVYRQGKGAVARALFREVDADLYVMVDGDGTYPAGAVHQLMEPVRAGRADMAVGDRRAAGGYRKHNQRRFHTFGNALVTRSINLLFRCRLNDIMSGYRVCSRRFVRNLTIPSDGFELETGMILHALEKRFTVVEIPVEYHDRPPDSFSKLRTFGDGYRVLREILWVYKDAKPLVFFTTMSAVVMAVALAIGVPVVIEFMHTGLVLKFPRAILASGLAVIGALLLICGFILDTIVRLHHENYELHLNRHDNDRDRS